MYPFLFVLRTVFPATRTRPELYLYEVHYEDNPKVIRLGTEEDSRLRAHLVTLIGDTAPASFSVGNVTYAGGQLTIDGMVIPKEYQKRFQQEITRPR